MKTDSLFFVIFLFAAFISAWIIKGKLRTLALVVFNTLFVLSFGVFHFWFLIAATLVAWLFGLLLDRYKNKGLLLAGCVLIAGILIFMKMGTAFWPGFSWTVPIGLSFYSFKTISYLADIYQRRLRARKNWFEVYAYIGFFAVFSAGPIHRAAPFFNELHQPGSFDYTACKNGAVLCALGIFEKLVLADYIGFVTTNLFAAEAYGMTLIFGLVLYSFEIYLNFDSYSNIAIGAAKLLGFTVGPNFKTPYLAENLKDFWRRWHISLSTWFRDYIYIPLGGNRKGKIRQAINLMLVFILSGLWHGSSFNFVLWGMGHGVLQLIENCFMKDRKAKSNFFFRAIKIVLNFGLVSFLWIFFRCPSFSEALRTIWACFDLRPFSLAALGINERQLIWLLIVLGIVLLTDLMRYRRDMILWLSKRNFLIRWSFYGALILLFLIFGMYGSGYDPSDFIYIQF